MFKIYATTFHKIIPRYDFMKRKNPNRITAYK